MVVLENIVSSVNSFLWDFFLLFALVGTGVWFTIRTKGIQIRYFTRGFKQVFGNIKLSGDKAGKDGMSSFQALATAIAAQVGTGNLAVLLPLSLLVVWARSSGCGFPHSSAWLPTS